MESSRPGSNERLLGDLNPAQRAAVEATAGSLVILAGAGTGKTRVISRRAAYAIETGVVAANKVLLVTFTDKAATEMVERMAALGHSGVMARTFHSHAVRQLRHFWPSRHSGADPPQVLESKLPLIRPLAQRLPGHYHFTPTKDLADAIEWAKVRRIPPARWEDDPLAEDRAPIPADLFARVYAGYERAKERAHRVDFEDMLALTVDLLESDQDAARLVQDQKTWISVDEYQDTNPLQERLLELWLGESADIAVVGDPDQTIYTFTGATPDYLLHFADKHPGARTIALTQNYRSTPQVLGLANRLTAGGPRGALTTSRLAGPEPTIDRLAGPEVEVNALVAGIRRLVGQRRGQVGDRGAGSDQRAAAADRGRADAGKHRVHRAWPALLRARRGGRGADAAPPGAPRADGCRACGCRARPVRRASGLRAGCRNRGGGGP